MQDEYSLGLRSRILSDRVLGVVIFSTGKRGRQGLGSASIDL